MQLLLGKFHMLILKITSIILLLIMIIIMMMMIIMIITYVGNY